MDTAIISDASCLIILDKVGQIELLRKSCNDVFITPEVANEFGSSLPSWMNVRSTSQLAIKNLLEQGIGLGESSAIALSFEFEKCLVILDDRKARKVAEDLGVVFTGTLGLIAFAKQKGIIANAKPIFDLIQSTNFRVSESLIKLILERLEE